MIIEDRLRHALDRHTETVEPSAPDWTDIERRAADVTRVRRLRRMAGLGALATAAAIAVLLVAVTDRDEERGLEVIDRPDAPTTVVEPSTTTAAPVVTPDPSSVGGIYPDARAYEEHGVDRYADPAVTARAFATDYLGMPSPVLGAFSGGTIDLRPSTRSTLTTTLTLHRVGEGGPWTVTAARGGRIAVTAPASSAQVGSPLRVTGSAQAYEGTVAVEVRQDGMRVGSSLGTSFVTGASDTMGPFDGTVAFRSPSEKAGAVLFLDSSGEDGSPLSATVIRVRFGGRATAPSTTAPSADRLTAESPLRFDGIGPVAIGMTEARARQAAGVAMRASEFGACRALQPEGEPAGVTFVLSGGDRINVITVGSGVIATDRGVRIGSSQAAVLAAYRGAEVRNPDEPRHWVFARSGAFAMVFEIEDGAVVAYRTGAREVVEQDEICE